MIKDLTGEEPRIIEKSDGRIVVKCGRAHLDGFMLYKEFFGDIMRWLKKTSRRGRGADGRKAEGAPHEEREDRVLQRTLRWLRQACGRRREVARGEGPVNAPPVAVVYSAMLVASYSSTIS